METVDAVTRRGVAAAKELRESMHGSVFLPGCADHARACQIWNGAISRRPALVARCESDIDVQVAVRLARAHQMPLSVLGGGHDWAGRSLCNDGIVIDLSAMRHVTIDVREQIASVAGGATARDVVHAAAAHGLAAVTGNCGDVGMAGLTLGGGYGQLSPKYGLALDNMESADIVLADGTHVTASSAQNPALYWALRGGGGNFGVVTAMRIRLHAVPNVMAGLITFPMSDAHTVLNGYAAAMASAPDELSVLAGILSGPDGTPAVFLSPVWCGDRAESVPVMDGLRRLGAPMMEHLCPMSCADLLAMYDAHIVRGRHYAIQTRWLADLTPQAISDIVSAGVMRTSPLSLLAMHHLHGMPARVPAAATAFGLRQDHYLVEIVAAWEPEAEKDGALHRRWARDVSQALAPRALPGGYANLLGPCDFEQIESAYGDNAPRLRDAKQQFDPGNVFSATPLPIRAPQ